LAGEKVAARLAKLIEFVVSIPYLVYIADGDILDRTLTTAKYSTVVVTVIAKASAKKNVN
jgi:hypothetical protein